LGSAIQLLAVTDIQTIILHMLRAPEVVIPIMIGIIIPITTVIGVPVLEADSEEVSQMILNLSDIKIIF
jgi:hypothetical protein